MNRDIKMIFFDIDGTLIDMKLRQITPRTIEALQKLQKNGIKICIATGRAPMELPYFDGVEFDAFLTYNGSYCFNRQEKIYSKPLSRKDVYTLLKNAKQMNRPLSLATSMRLAANGADEDLIEYYGFGGMTVKIAEDFDTVAAQDEIYQVLIGCRVSEYGTLMKDVEHAKIAAWWDRAMDVIPANGGKGRGIAKVIEYYHLDRSQTMAFGDGNNDIEMLEAVGTGVAMGNASEELKQIADEICGNSADDGIYWYCVEKGLIEAS